MGRTEGRSIITLVVARAANGVIGQNNTIPWRLPEDLQQLKATTIGHVLIMGRKTWDSIGRPLPGRRTIVVTRDKHWQAPGAEPAHSLAQAIELASDQPLIFIMGGAALYREGLAIADRLIITEVDLTPDGDVRFPDIDPKAFKCRPGVRRVSRTGITFRIDVYERMPS